ncbi:hypothetical protein RUM43_002252 [Polyplax serrata]|uniref:Phosphatidylinositol-specific phospholipase C X domain-containing protein n=1 Tax=Polyplax serrata TaxID=468196 RepID=A0AAN8PCD5_POLSC
MEYQQPLSGEFQSEQNESAFQTVNQYTNNVKIDLENWMGDLPEHLTCVPIIYIAIPGSHNSFSYSISPNSEVSPDSPPFVQSLGKWCKPISNRIIFNWSQGQQEDVARQLALGIRYFDVRLVVHKNEIRISHGLYGGKILHFLEIINEFLSSHPKEIVILDFQHFYQFDQEHHERMISALLHIFGGKICRRQRRMRDNTISKLRECGNQVIIVYRHLVTRSNDIFWPSGTWATPWPNKVKVNELIDCLNKGLTTRKDGMGYVSQGILTPTPKYVAMHVFGSLRKLAFQTNKKVVSWLESKNNGAHGVNVVICDFVEKNSFCEKVVRLNYKGCDDYQKHFHPESDM